jgi:uncharacterized protein (DUF1919 family)
MNLKRKLAETYDDIKEKSRIKIAPIRRKKINDTTFSIISNNCWGGIVYQRYGLPYASPTAGMYFFAEDYIKFVSNLKYYMSIPMSTISVNQSKYKEIILKRNHDVFPLGRIDDVEVVFRHYKTADEAVEKWERRKKRINYNNLIIKFSEMNLCTDDLMNKFLAMPYENKFAFVRSPQKIIDPRLIYYPGYESMEFLPEDTKYYSKYINLNVLINEHVIQHSKTRMWE